MGIGKLATASASNGYSRIHSYDGFGRPSQVQITIPGANSGNPYTMSKTYTAAGQLNAITYPSGFAVQYAYTTLGYLAQLKDNSSGQVYWAGNSVDAEMHLTSQTSGNGITTSETFNPNTGRIQTVQAGAGNLDANLSFAFDTIGNLTQRTDANESLTENFCYDVLNRLTSYAVNGANCSSGSLVKTVSYDPTGNIAAKSDIGSYFYPIVGQAQPHAVSSITGTVNGVSNPTYTYDPNGNMTAGAGRTVAYTSYNMVASISEGATSLTYAYDCEHNRISQAAPEGTTYYLRDLVTGAFVEQFVGASLSSWNEYLVANGQLVGARYERSDGTVFFRYVIADHLNSVSVLTDETGSLAERDSYDAWGERRNPDGSDATGPIASAITRGFTGQEQIDDVGLINFNARIYDPAIGRFMSADSVLPRPYRSQSFNRYSYVVNRPLTLVDPTGHDDNEVCDATGCHNQQDASGGDSGSDTSDSSSADSGSETSDFSAGYSDTSDSSTGTINTWYKDEANHGPTADGYTPDLNPPDPYLGGLYGTIPGFSGFGSTGYVADAGGGGSASGQQAASPSQQRSQPGRNPPACSQAPGPLGIPMTRNQSSAMQAGGVVFGGLGIWAGVVEGGESGAAIGMVGGPVGALLAGTGGGIIGGILGAGVGYYVGTGLDAIGFHQSSPCTSG